MNPPTAGRYEDVAHTIGNTPLIRLSKVTEGIHHPLYAKAECFNPGGSLKDRIGLAIIEAAEQRGSWRAPPLSAVCFACAVEDAA